jgi:hypothetical protein
MSDFDPTKVFKDLLVDLDKHVKELEERQRIEHEKFASEHPEQVKCNHGIVFDEEAAKELSKNTTVDTTLDPAVAFIMGPSSSTEIRKRWPRLCGLCPKGCGYNGIYYASFAHYLYGDW